MNKEIETIYKEFFDYYETVKYKFENILDKCNTVNNLFVDIINNIYLYYDQSEYYKNISELMIYFEIEEFIISIINKVKKLIEYVNYIYYDVVECNDDLFTSYVGVMYYISILDDFLMYIKNKEIDSSDYEQELAELNNMIYNKIELVDGFNQYVFNKINELFKEYEEFSPSILIFKIIKTKFNELNETEAEDYIQDMINDFINNMESYKDLVYKLKEKDIYLYNKILKLENVILNLQVSLRSNEKLFEENDEAIKKAYLIELTDMYNAWMIEFHRVYDLYGIDYAIKFKEIIYYAAIISDIINTFGDIESENEQLGDYFIGCYESILENNLDDIDQFIDYGKDLLDDLCEKYNIVTNKLEEQVEFVYTLFQNKKND